MTAGVQQGSEPWRDPQAQPYIRIEGVTRRFGEFVAVDAVSLDIYRGEIFCLLGGSGCGKTTLLRMLAGFETPSAGRIRIDGADMAGVPPYERPVNMMFQSYALFPHMTVEQNVAFGLKQERLPAAQIATRVAQMLGIVRLSGLERRKPHQLSGGQRQRVALARSLIKRPKLLLLDEPLAALDRKLREHTQFELVNIQQRLGVTFVVVTHDQEEAMTLASRIGVMNQGRIVQVGTPHEIYEFPATRFVSEFIGNVNLFEGHIVEGDAGHVVIESADLGGRIRVGHGVSAAPGALVWTAVRPEKMQFAREAPAMRDVAAAAGRSATAGAVLNAAAAGPNPAAGAVVNAAAGAVREIAYMGDMSIYLVQLDSGKTVRITQPNTQRQAESPLARDERVRVSWHESAAIVVTQ